MNKKAFADTMFWFIRIIVLAIVIYFIQATVRGAVADLTDTSGSEYQILSERVLFSPDGVCYVDYNGRVYPGIIDLSKYSSDRLQFEGLNGAIRLRLIALHDKVIFPDAQVKHQKEIFTNQETYTDIEDLSFSERYGLVEKSKYVLALDSEGKMHPAILEVGIGYEI